MVLEKTLESPLDCKEIQPGHPKDQSWVFLGSNDAKAETPVFQHHSVKASMTTGKTIALTRQTLVSKVMFLLLNILSRLVIIFFQGVSVF